MTEHRDPAGPQPDADEMGGVEWDGVPAGTSGSAAPGTEGAGTGKKGDIPHGERPPRRGPEDVGDASGELGVVGKQGAGGQPSGAGDESSSGTAGVGDQSDHRGSSQR